MDYRHILEKLFLLKKRQFIDKFTRAQPHHLMRLNKYLSQCGIASRRKTDQLIQMGKTKVNGKICLDPAYQINKGVLVTFNGESVSPIKEKIVIMLHKPIQVITSVGDSHGRRTVMDLISSKIRVTPIGRLDRNTSGLLLLTNDGDLQYYLTHPKYMVAKDYQVSIQGVLNKRQQQALMKGISIGRKEVGRAQVLSQTTENEESEIILRLRQGKKREIRRIFQRLHYRLLTLKRIRIGNLQLGDLAVGQYRRLSVAEIQALRNQSERNMQKN